MNKKLQIINSTDFKNQCEKNGEIWRPVVGYEGYYEISNIGRVLSVGYMSRYGNYFVRKYPILLQQYVPHLYKAVLLCKNGKRNIQLVHRLVATAFIDNVNNLPQVNHKDGNKYNNHVNNLEWVTAQENVIHSYVKLKRAPNKPNIGLFGGKNYNAKRVVVKNSKNEIIGEYDSAIEAAQETGKSKDMIRMICRGVRPQIYENHYYYK